MRLDPGTSVYGLQKLIHHHFSIPLTNIALHYKSKVLNGRSTLEDADIKSDDTIVVVRSSVRASCILLTAKIYMFVFS